MTDAQILAAVRRGIREPSAVKVADSDITAAVLVAVHLLALKIRESDETFFHRIASLSSDTYIFPWPTACISVLSVWDMGTTAGDISGATQAAPIVITETAHGATTGDIRIVQDVGGLTEANGTFKVTVIDDDSYSLDGSDGSAGSAYTSGGKAFQPPADADSLDLKSPSRSCLSDPDHWFARGRNVVVDDRNFTNDIIINYDIRPSTVADIPEQYHQGIVSWCVFNLVTVPKPDATDYADKTEIYSKHSSLWSAMLEAIGAVQESAPGPHYVTDEMELGDM